MSTVAWDGRFLVADTQATTGDSRIGTMVKLYDLTHYAMAVVGYASFGHALALWLSGCGERPTSRENWYCSALVYDKHTHKMYLHDSEGCFDFVYEDYAALGSGVDAALSVLRAGKNASMAVREAIKLDAFTGGEVISILAPGKGRIPVPLTEEDLLSFPSPLKYQSQKKGEP